DVRVRFLHNASERDIRIPGCGEHSFSFPNLEIAVYVSAEPAAAGVSRVTVRIANHSGPKGDSMACAQTILCATNGEFISLMDPPEALREIAAACDNVGTWPVLAGDEGQRAIMLSSPIILYDYPRIAPESSGDLFDSTEIDEMLALRILTLTSEEK